MASVSNPHWQSHSMFKKHFNPFYIYEIGSSVLSKHPTQIL